MCVFLNKLLMELKARKPLQQMWRIRNLMKYWPIKINVFLIKIHLLLKSKTPVSSSSLQSMTEWSKFKALQQKQHLFSDSQVSRKFQFLPYAIIWNLSALRIWCVAASRWIIPLHPQPLKKGSELLLSVGEDAICFPVKFTTASHYLLNHSHCYLQKKS